ncbi:MAG: hypothetical protein EBR82_74505 [Caulobacteraceae bacterium]|nr:hypothetical protein [Caulobacteraceae bacterium]
MTDDLHAAQWRPISTAPRDGTEFVARLRGGRPFIAWRRDGFGWARDYNFRGEHVVDAEFDEWLPLPAPPEPTP